MAGRDPVAGDMARLGWAGFAGDARSRAWAKAALAAGQRVVADPDMRAAWLQCQGTWFVGVDALPNTHSGALGDVALAGPVWDHLTERPALHPAQLSVVYPGYPKPRAGESDAAFGYRLRRDAAHVDGVIADGPDRRRRIAEPHAFIVGLPLTDTAPQASPLVVWEGSHRIMRAAFAKVLAPHPVAQWAEVDVTDAYQAARRRCFETCTRRTLHGRPGEALLLHRLTLHGIAPWPDGVTAPSLGRMMAYFRPPMPGGVAAWLDPLP